MDEKIVILYEFYDKKLVFFFMWFGRYFFEKDLGNFEYLRGEYEIDFCFKEVKNIFDGKKKKIGICNRWYECL